MSRVAFEVGTLKESLVMALSAIRANKLRSMLTLLGIVVGIFSVISVMTAMEALRNSIEEGMSDLGVNTFQIQKYPRGINRRRWFMYRNRKDITYDQALQVQQKTNLAEAVGLEVVTRGRTIFSKGRYTNPNVSVYGENLEALITNDWNVEEGRAFTAGDMELARPVVVLGRMVVEKLFDPGEVPVGKTIKIENGVYDVIGVFENKGSTLGGNQGNFVAMPLTTFFQKLGKGRSVNIMVKAASAEVYDDCLEQTRAILRVARNVPPGEEDDFGYFSNDSMIAEFNEVTLYVRIGVLVISSIALIAAGVGIMNIMLVSVTERTREIGIRKAIGARRSDLLLQFVLEAITLCQIGGFIGVVMGILGGNVVGLLLDIPVVIPFDWAAIGFGACLLVGLIFGVYPAWKASTLDPIEALRYE